MVFPKKAFHNVLSNSSFLPQLSRFGFAAADLPITDHKFLLDVRNDILSLHTNDQLVANWSRFVTKGETTALQKTGIYENNLPLDNPSSTPALEELWENRHFLTNTINENNHSLKENFIPKLSSPSIKIQYNSGEGACFPCHFDSDASVDDRCLTFILYLNPEYLNLDTAPHIAAKQGGHFIAYPLPFPPIFL